MLKNYTIEFSEKDLASDYDLVQYTLNKYQTALTRGTFSKLASWGSPQKIVVHMDYIKTFTRFPIMCESLRSDFVSEIVSILLASNKELLSKADKNSIKPEVLGVVLHSDTPLSKAGIQYLFENGIPKSRESATAFCAKFWGSSFFDTPDSIFDELESVFLTSESINDFIENLYTHAFITLMSSIRASFEKFHRDLTVRGKVFLENTTKVPFKDGKSSVDMLQNLVRRDSMSALCFDEEHSYASGDYTLLDYDKGEINYDLLSRLSSRDLVHLNTIPDNVTKGSFLDRHSDVTIFESKAEPSLYFSLAAELEKRNINYVREIKVVERELKQLEEYDNDYRL